MPRLLLATILNNLLQLSLLCINRAHHAHVIPTRRLPSRNKVGQLCLVFMLLCGFSPLSHALVSGGSVSASISSPEEEDSYSFTANAGDSVQLSVSGDVTMLVYLYAPNGAYLGSDYTVVVRNSLAQSGTYTVVVRAYGANETGSYDLHFVKAPGASEYGPMNGNDEYAGTITRGDLDSYSFTANAGESVQLSVSGDVTMAVYLYAPDGAYLGSDYTVVVKNFLPQSGTYTVVVRAYGANETGSYDFHFVKAPGASEYGPMNGNDEYAGTITRGDLDSYSFTANAGDSVQLSVSGDVTMLVYLYGPDGAYLGADYTVVVKNFLPQSGTYTVVLRTYGANETGSYDFHFIKAPGANEHGAVSNGTVISGVITRADIDSYSFTANAGDSVQLSVSGDVTMLVYLYGPDGYYLGADYTVVVKNSLSQSGTYTVVVRAYGANQTGSYQLTLFVEGTSLLGNNGPGLSERAKEACDEGSMCYSEKYKGNPINTAQGFKAQPEMDYRNGHLHFTRIYRSDSDWTNRDLGAYWRHTYFRHLNFLLNGTTPNVEVIDGRGAVVGFEKIGNTWQTLDPDYKAQFENIYDANSFLTGYRYTTPADTEEYFDTSGLLTRIVYRGGESIDFTYDTASRLASVTDEEGHALTFAYDASDRIQSMTTPDGSFSYDYDANNNLTQVTQPDTKTRIYHYEDTTYLNALTGITNENNVRIATWGYDAQGRAIHSEHAGGVDSYTVAYNVDDSVTVTNPLGKQTTYQFQTIHGVRKITAIDRLASPNSPATTESNTYTTEGWLETATDAEGNVTRYTYDTRGLEVSRTEAELTPEERTITTTWDATYRLPDVVTEQGRTTDYDYDAFGRVTSMVVTDTATTESRSTTYTYHLNTVSGNGDTILGRLATVDGPRTSVSDITSYDYDANYNLIHITNALGHEGNFTAFDASGRPLTTTDENGVVTTNVYDAMGRLTSQTRIARTTVYAYDDAGLLAQLTLPDGRFYTYGYDNAQRLTSIQNASGERAEYVLDDAGNRLEEIMRDATGIITGRDRQEFDELSRLLASIETINSTDARTAYSYDDNGNLETITDPYTNTSTYLYDALQRVTAFTDAATGATGSSFNALDQLTSVTAPNNAQTQFTYDAFGDVMQEASPDRGTTNYTYDSTGNLATKTDARGITASYSYDALNRLISISYPVAGEDIAYIYDANPGGAVACSNGVGRLCRVTDESGVTHFAYDEYGNITQRVHTELGVDYTHQFAYDAGDQLTQLVGSDGRVVNYSRDAERRISQVSANVNGMSKVLVSNIRYNPDGQETSATLGNGLLENRNYDENGLLLNNIQAVLGDVAPTSSPDGLINVADLLIMMRIALGLITPTAEQLRNGDLYPVSPPDGIINIQDLILLQDMVMQ